MGPDFEHVVGGCSFISTVCLFVLCLSETRKEGVHHFFEAEKIQHVDSLFACEWRGEVQLLWHSLFFLRKSDQCW